MGKYHEYFLVPSVAIPRARRGGKKKASYEKWMIENDHVSVSEIAQRLGISVETARKRLRFLQRRDEPVTWKALEEIRVPK